MSEIHDYVKFRGDLSFKERSFNDCDNLVFSTLVYLDWTDIVPDYNEGKVYLKDACKILLDKANGDLKPYVRSIASVDIRLVEEVEKSTRFGNVFARDLMDIRSEQRSMQFCGVTFDIEDDLTYVAFRGTDSTLVGWRENFIMSFTETEAQKAAANYLSHQLKKAREDARRIIVGGHSKGGNLAAYAASRCPKNYADLIEMVYSNDGPGMDPDIFELSVEDVVPGRYRKIVPEYSVVGCFFVDKIPDVIVKSTRSRVMQHDPMSWQVNLNTMDFLPASDPEADKINEALREWFASMDPEDRQHFTNELFDLLEKTGAETLTELYTNRQGLKELYHALRDLDEKSAAILKRLVYSLAKTSMGIATEKAKTKAHGFTARLEAALERLAARAYGDSEDIRDLEFELEQALDEEESTLPTPSVPEADSGSKTSEAGE